MGHHALPTRAPEPSAEFADRDYEVVIHEGPLPERGELELTEAERAFREFQRLPEYAAWARESLKGWHKRTGVPMRRGEA